VDAACYLHLNAVSLARILDVLEHPENAARYRELAAKTAAAVLAKMWDPATGFFHDLREDDEARMATLNVVGFDPFFCGIAGPDYAQAMEHLDNEEEFAAPWPVPSTAMNGPAYAPNAWWFDHHPKGPDGAMWNGPTWPYTNTTVLLSVARLTRLMDHALDARFAWLLDAYTRMHFRNGNIDDPCLLEHYRPDTGVAVSLEEDYYHSAWVDLVVTGVCGVLPQPDGSLIIDPIDCGLEWFSLERLPYRGHQLTVTWNSGTDGTPDSLPVGLTVKVDSTRRAHSPRLERLELPALK
jgi:hypothetical protein